MSTTLHKDLTGADLHVNKVHADTHVVGGTDPLTLAESQVTDLTVDLADLASGLNGKAPTDHGHVKADITDFPVLIPGTGNGDVVGLTPATPGHLATYADETGKNIQDGGTVPTTLPASDVSPWAKAPTKPAYTPTELGAETVANKSISVATDAASDVAYPSVKAVKDYADGLVAGLLDYRGAYDASGNAYPTTGGSGTAGAVMKGDMWAISVAGVLGGVAIQGGDVIIAKIDTPAQTAGNWNILNTNVSYVPEDQANKENTTLDTSTAKYPTNALVKTGLDGKVGTGDVRLTDARAPTAHGHVKADVTDFPVSLPASDVSAWAKAGAKPTYTSSEITNISAAGQELINDANAAAQLTTLGVTAAGKALLDDTTAAAQLVTLGTAAYSEGTWTPVLNAFTIVGAAPAVSGTYKRIGNLVFLTVRIAAGAGGNTSVAAIGGGISNITGQPFAVSGHSNGSVVTDSVVNLGIVSIDSSTIYMGTFSATTSPITICITHNT